MPSDDVGSGSGTDHDIYVMRITGHEYHDTTTVYTTGSGAEVFHADVHCPHLLNSGSEWSDAVHLTAHSLPRVMQSYLSPYKRCRHCTLPMQETARIAVQQDGMPSALLQYYEPGDTKVTTQVTRGVDGDEKVRQWTETVRPDGGDV